MEKKPVDPEKIIIENINVKKGYINSDTETLEKPITLFDLKFNVDHGVDINNKAARFVLTISMTGVDEETQKPLSVSGEYSIEFLFTVENLEDYVIRGETITLDANLGVTLLSIAYSTARGIIATRTMGTVLNGIILPVIDPKKFFIENVKDDIV